MIISACDPGHPDALALVEELSVALAALTGASGRASFSAADVRLPRSLFVVARGADGALLGCGALRQLGADVAEVKRMYARPGTRAVGAALLAHLEAEARAAGYRAIWLETRRVNARALSFYQRHGYRPIANYGQYAGRSDAVCLGKTLA